MDAALILHGARDSLGHLATAQQGQMLENLGINIIYIYIYYLYIYIYILFIYILFIYIYISVKTRKSMKI